MKAFFRLVEKFFKRILNLYGGYAFTVERLFAEPLSRKSLECFFYKNKDNLIDRNLCLIFKRSLIDRKKV